MILSAFENRMRKFRFSGTLISTVPKYQKLFIELVVRTASSVDRLVFKIEHGFFTDA